MERIQIQPRIDWKKKVEDIGFGYHTVDDIYWYESAVYKFSMKEIEKIESATAELWEMCLVAVQYVIDNKLYSQFHIPNYIIPHIEKSWEDDVPAIYGRFDLCIKNGNIKLLEFNADTPTSLFESSVIQWEWLKDFDRNKDQFNSIHEKLIEYWKYLKDYLHKGIIHFTCVKGNLEDLTTTEYIRDCAIQAGYETKLIFIDDIGWNSSNKVFIDLEDQEIKNIFKLYPWEWIVNEEFGENIIKDVNIINWIEPSWKMILSNKAILPILWKIHPFHPYLLNSSFKKEDVDYLPYVKKPLLSREGANIEIFDQMGNSIEHTDGEYGEEGYIYQEYYELPKFDENYALVGSWLIGQESAGIGIRETTSKITNNTSRFVPHLIE